MQAKKIVLDFFADYILKELGIIYPEENYYQLESRLEQIREMLKLDNINQLHKIAQNSVSPKLRALLIDYATNNETSFFRDRHLFDYFKQYSSDFYKHKNRNMKIWSSACSFGQEIYSAAIMLEEALKVFPRLSYEILATDVSQRALDYASEGIYSPLHTSRGLDKQYQDSYFVSEGEQQQIKRSIRNKITFQKQNLLEPFAHLGTFDVIFCRNVLIYQPVENKTDIINRLYNQLEDDGIFILGGSESLIGLSERFHLERSGKVTYYVKDLKSKKVA